jgi:hypothetical protein
LRQACAKFQISIATFRLAFYAYQQITDDFGQSPILGGFRSRVFGIDPQLGCKYDGISRREGLCRIRWGKPAIGLEAALPGRADG